MKKNKVLMTGCAGFIGGHALEWFLKKGCEVIGVDKMTYASNCSVLKVHPRFKFYQADVCQTSVIKRIAKENNVNCIVHFAAESHVDNSILGNNCFIDTNITGTKSLMEVCKDLEINMCHISTDEVYGPIEEGSFSEEDKLSPQNFYSATKAAAEHIVCAYSNTFDIDYVMIRMSNNYGPRQNKEKFIPTILNSIKKGIKIPLYGDGQNIRDWIYVKDSVKIIYNILQSANFNKKVYNVTFKDERNNIDVISEILNYFNLTLEDSVEFVKDRLGHDSRYSITNDKMLEFVDFKPTDFKSGIQETIKYYS
tara:strand:+ start:1086 stop:2012 length:927 start_codon:yes stop_codon:yes gene_type:complete